MSQDLRSARRKLPAAEELELERAMTGSGRRWPLMIVLGLGIGAAAGWYFGVYQPEQVRLSAETPAQDAGMTPVVAVAAAPPPEPTPVVAFDAGVVMVDAGAPPVIDAGAPEPVTLVEQVVPARVKTKAELKQDFDSLQSRGESLLAQDKPEAALSAFGKASDLRPDRVEPMVGRGLSLLDLGNAAAAEAAFEQAIKVNARYGPGIMGLAEALRTQGKYDKAIEWYRRYLEVMPDGTEANVARTQIERLKK